MKTHEAVQSKSPSTATKQASDYKILVVEDEDVLRESYEIILSTEDYDLDVARNGQEALDFCEHKQYDLILLDLMMPVLDGRGFLKQFKNEGTKIIILSNLSSGTELDEALKYGACSSILKASLSPRQLLAAIRTECNS